MVSALGATLQRAASETKRLVLFEAHAFQVKAHAFQVETRAFPFRFVAGWRWWRKKKSPAVAGDWKVVLVCFADYFPASLRATSSGEGLRNTIVPF